MNFKTILVKYIKEKKTYQGNKMEVSHYLVLLNSKSIRMTQSDLFIHIFIFQINRTISIWHIKLVRWYFMRIDHKSIKNW